MRTNMRDKVAENEKKNLYKILCCFSCHPHHFEIITVAAHRLHTHIIRFHNIVAHSSCNVTLKPTESIINSSEKRNKKKQFILCLFFEYFFFTHFGLISNLHFTLFNFQLYQPSFWLYTQVLLLFSSCFKTSYLYCTR